VAETSSYYKFPSVPRPNSSCKAYGTKLTNFTVAYLRAYEEKALSAWGSVGISVGNAY
jgi:hypothetical protein